MVPVLVMLSLVESNTCMNITKLRTYVHTVTQYKYSIRFATPGGRLMASWLAAQYNGVLVLGSSTVLYPL